MGVAESKHTARAASGKGGEEKASEVQQKRELYVF